VARRTRSDALAAGRLLASAVRRAGISVGDLGVPELLIILLLVVPVALPIWAVIDAAVRPDTAWAATGQNKILWVVLPIVTNVLCLGWVAAIVYFAAIRPKVVAAQQQPGLA
jgi:hypothetical protein